MSHPEPRALPPTNGRASSIHNEPRTRTLVGGPAPCGICAGSLLVTIGIVIPTELNTVVNETRLELAFRDIKHTNLPQMF